MPGEEREQVVGRRQVRAADARQLRLRELRRRGRGRAEPERQRRETAGEVVRVDLDLLQAAAELELVVAGDVGRVVDDLVGPRVAALRLEAGPVCVLLGTGVERAAMPGTLKRTPAAEVDVALEGDRREVAADPQLVLEAGRRRPAPRAHEPLRRGLGEHQRARQGDEVEVGAIVGLLEVAVDELEAVLGIQLVVGARHPLVAIVEIVLLEAVPRRVEDAIRARVAAVVAVHLVRAWIERRGCPTELGIDGLARELKHVGLRARSRRCAT